MTDVYIILFIQRALKHWRTVQGSFHLSLKYSHLRDGRWQLLSRTAMLRNAKVDLPQLEHWGMFGQYNKP